MEYCNYQDAFDQLCLDQRDQMQHLIIQGGVDSISNITLCKQMKQLELHFSAVQDIQPIQQILTLETLLINSCKQIKKFDIFQTQMNIYEIILINVEIQDLKILNSLNKLKKIQISSCSKLIDFSNLPTCSNLVEVMLTQLEISSLDATIQLKNLKSLNLLFNHKLNKKYQKQIINNTNSISAMFAMWENENYK